MNSRPAAGKTSNSAVEAVSGTELDLVRISAIVRSTGGVLAGSTMKMPAFGNVCDVEYGPPGGFAKSLSHVRKVGWVTATWLYVAAFSGSPK